MFKAFIYLWICLMWCFGHVWDMAQGAGELMSQFAYLAGQYTGWIYGAMFDGAIDMVFDCIMIVIAVVTVAGAVAVYKLARHG